MSRFFRRPWCRWAVFTCSIFALVFGWVKLRQPKSMALVSRHSLALVTLPETIANIAFQNGILWDDDRGNVHASRWDGTTLWFMSHKELGSDFDSYEIAQPHLVSPDLRTVAAVNVRSSPQFLRAWHNGKFHGDIPLSPSVGRQHRHSRTELIRNHGEIWVLTATHLLYLNRTGLLTRVPLPVTLKYATEAQIAPDAQVLVAGTARGWDYYTIAVNAPSVTLHHAYTIPYSVRTSDEFAHMHLLWHGEVMFDGGRRYNKRGQVASADGWKFEGAASYDAENCRIIAQRKKGLRIRNLQSGQCWTIPIDASWSFQQATLDGRFALLYRHDSWRNNAALSSFMMHPNLVGTCAPLLDRKFPPRHVYTIYERPGRLRARLVLADDTDPYRTFPSGKVRYVSAFLSADGHTVHIAGDHSDGRQASLDIVEYHW